MDRPSPVALITGAGGGIGRALCEAFKLDGYRVIATDLSHVDGLECDQFIEADLRQICNDASVRQEFVDQLQLQDTGLTVLVNNAATQILNTTEDITTQEWKDTLDVNLLAPFLLTQALLEPLQLAKGSVVNIGSVHARATKRRFVCYATSKSALAGLTKALAVDLGDRVRVNAINPAAVATPMLLEGFEGKDELFAQLAGMHPLGRIAEPAEVAQVAVFLASNKASFISGAALDVDGGILSHLHDPD
jgi:NAD(P)-dependent dehydrogenase (short-subunit alcohol dehydrogenase family)